LRQAQASAVLLVMEFCACGARTELSSSADVHADAGLAQKDAADEDAASADAATLQIGVPVVVLDGAAEGVGLQRFGQLVWTGEKFAVVWCENREGHIFVVVRFITSAGVVEAGKYVISDDYDDMASSPQSTWLSWTGSELAVFWTVEQGIMMRRLSVQGALLSSPIHALSGLGTNAYLRGGVHRKGATDLVWIDDLHVTYSYTPYFARVSDLGEPVGNKVSMLDGYEPMDTVGGFAAQGDGYSMVWNRREAIDIDTVFLSLFDPGGDPYEAPHEIYASDSALLSYQGPSIAEGHGGAYVTFWDMDRGVVVQRWQAQGPQEVALMKDATDTAVLAVASDDSVGLLYGRGEWEPTNPLAVELAFALVGAQGVTAGPAVVNKAPAGQGCLEAYTIVSTGDGFGLLWAEDCTVERTIYFARVTK
jgi:hypothetical protein